MSADKLQHSQPCAGDLPSEVLSHIFNFLPYSDLKLARLVCSQWYDASQDIKLLDKEITVSLSEVNSVFQETLLSSKRDFLHLSVREDLMRWYDSDYEEHHAIWYNTKFWSRFGPKLRSLTIHNCKLHRNQFLQVLRSCSRLRQLDIVACANLFRRHELALPEENTQNVVLQLPNLQSLRIAALYNPGAELFDIIVSSACNLKSLSLDECLDPIRLSCPEGLTCEHIQTFLDKNCNCSFDLNLRCLEGDDFTAFIKLVLMPNVRLRCLQIHYNYSVEKFFSDNVMDLITSEKCLEELELSCEVGDLVVGAICSTLLNLKTLTLLFCSEVVRGIGLLFTLKKMISLKMMNCYKVTSAAVMCGLCGEVNTSLKSLTLTCGDLLSPGVIVEIARTHPCLTYLDLSNCDGVRNSSVQAIFRHLTSLQALVLSSCRNLDDSGLCGKLEDLDTRLYPVGYSLSLLRGLRMLNLSNCSIDGSAFKAGLKMPDVRHVILDDNEISSEAFKCFVKNNRTIENLQVAQCQELTDDVLDVIGLNLLRLKRINIQGCNVVSKNGISLLQRRIEGLKIQVTIEA